MRKQNYRAASAAQRKLERLLIMLEVVEDQAAENVAGWHEYIRDNFAGDPAGASKAHSMLADALLRYDEARRIRALALRAIEGVTE